MGTTLNCVIEVLPQLCPQVATMLAPECCLQLPHITAVDSTAVLELHAGKATDLWQLHDQLLTFQVLTAPQPDVPQPPTGAESRKPTSGQTTQRRMSPTES
jgi:hypothetical protein